jgi:hypothetical protein
VLVVHEVSGRGEVRQRCEQCRLNCTGSSGVGGDGGASAAVYGPISRRRCAAVGAGRGRCGSSVGVRRNTTLGVTSRRTASRQRIMQLLLSYTRLLSVIGRWPQLNNLQVGLVSGAVHMTRAAVADSALWVRWVRARPRAGAPFGLNAWLLLLLLRQRRVLLMLSVLLLLLLAL